MTLTFTGTIGVLTADRVEVRTVLIGALGCNIAWGIIDGGLYLMACLAERGRNVMLVRAVRTAASAEDAHRVIADALPAPLAPAFQPAQLEVMRTGISGLPEPPARPRLTGRDWMGALGVCILVVLTTFPVVIPFIFIDDIKLAMRISNAIAMVLMFLCGFFFARYAGLRPWVTGLIMVAVGAAMVGIAIALGG
jgi:VIT1/CCC1 family predicted Fe2+/Mn2+ transporter